MRRAGSHLEFLNIWLEFLTNKFNDYSTPVASSLQYSNTNSNVAKLDSGVTQHYIKPSHNSYLQNLIPITGPNIQLPNNDELQITHTGHLPLHPNLPLAATRSYILSNLSNKLMLSVGQLCDNDCKVLFKKNNCDV